MSSKFDFQDDDFLYSFQEQPPQTLVDRVKRQMGKEKEQARTLPRYQKRFRLVFAVALTVVISVTMFSPEFRALMQEIIRTIGGVDFVETPVPVATLSAGVQVSFIVVNSNDRISTPNQNTAIVRYFPLDEVQQFMKFVAPQPGDNWKTIWYGVGRNVQLISSPSNCLQAQMDWAFKSLQLHKASDDELRQNSLTLSVNNMPQCTNQQNYKPVIIVGPGYDAIEVQVNGKSAAIYKGQWDSNGNYGHLDLQHLVWQTNGLVYELMGSDKSITQDDLIKIANTVK